MNAQPVANEHPYVAKRSIAEVLNHIEKVGTDFFGFERLDLITDGLDLDTAEMLLGDVIDESTTISQWEAIRTAPEWRIRDYMDFAIDKALNHRGLSALRSIGHLKAWVWLDGNDELYAFLNNDRKGGNYGAGHLKRICEVYHIKYEYSYEFERMSQGKKCRPDCREGCS